MDLMTISILLTNIMICLGRPEVGLQYDPKFYEQAFPNNSLGKAHYNPWACNYRLEPGYKCLSCNRALHCYVNNFALLVQCAGFFPYCRNGFCSMWKSDGCIQHPIEGATTLSAVTQHDKNKTITTLSTQMPGTNPIILESSLTDDKNKTDALHEHVADINEVVPQESVLIEDHKPDVINEQVIGLNEITPQDSVLIEDYQPDVINEQVIGLNNITLQESVLIEDNNKLDVINEQVIGLNEIAPQENILIIDNKKADVINEQVMGLNEVEDALTDNKTMPLLINEELAAMNASIQQENGSFEGKNKPFVINEATTKESITDGKIVPEIEKKPAKEFRHKMSVKKEGTGRMYYSEPPSSSLYKLIRSFLGILG